MHLPSASAMLGAWERGLDQGPVERGLTLLALGCPESTAEALAELSIGERDRRLLALREDLFGPRMTGLISCVACGEPLELDFATFDLYAAPKPNANELSVRGEDYAIELRLPDSRDLLVCATSDPGEAASVLLRRCVVSVRLCGEPARAEDLPPPLVAESARRLTEADPHADMRFALACASCGHEWRAPFDIVPFLWTELEAWAGRMVRDVHVLASAYGWTERDILALSPVRRRQYLRMLGA
jgi:hypothetical protein